MASTWNASNSTVTQDRAEALAVTERELDDNGLLADATKRRRRRKLVIRASQLAVLVVAIGLWQLICGPRGSGALIDSYYVSRPSDVIGALHQWIGSGLLWSSIEATVEVTLIGLVIGLVGGLVIGFVLGVNPVLSAVLNPFISALYSIPRLALSPLLLLWFGIGISSKLALVVTLVGFLVFFNTYSGVRDVDQDMINEMKLMGANRWQIYGKLVLPSAMTWIVAGLRVATPMALVGAVTAEMLMSDRGLGFLVLNSSSQFYTQGVFAAIIVLMVIAMILNGLITLFERRALHWKPELRDGGRL